MTRADLSTHTPDDPPDALSAEDAALVAKMRAAFDALRPVLNAEMRRNIQQAAVMLSSERQAEVAR